MNNLLLKNIARFIVLVLLQIFIFNKILLFGSVNPYVYILFVLLLPLETPKYFLLISAFVLGLSIDYFSNTIGTNIASSVFIAWIRPALIRALSPKLDLSQGLSIGIQDFGFKWMLLYTSILVTIHHFTLFFLEVFRFNELLDTLKRAGLSTVFTILIIIISQYLFYKPKK